MKITFIPVSMASSGSKSLGMSHAILHREGAQPKIILTDVTSQVLTHGSTRWIQGVAVDGFAPTDLQDGDTIIYPPGSMNDDYPLLVDMIAGDGTLTPFPMINTVASMAAGMESARSVIMTTTLETNAISQKATQVYQSLRDLYTSFPKYRNIMMKENGEIVSRSLAKLVADQNDTLQKELEVYLLSMSSGFMSLPQKEASAQKVLAEIPFDEFFQLLTEEEQVGHFIQFAKMSSSEKREHVSDALIEAITNSDEYQSTLESLSANGLGESQTQQFNVLQQVGYFSKSRMDKDILYNLSDMGAGKTLMTVQAIAVLDRKQVSTWLKNNPDDDSTTFRVPDKHIITPTLSVRSSWIDTFKIFYDVREINEFTYALEMDYDGRKVQSRIYVSPFTIKNSLLYVGETLPVAQKNTYLIIDEIHQLVKRNVAKTKFFPPATTPVQLYKTFILSGTMSNLLSREWLNFLRFMGIPITTSSAAQAKTAISGARERMSADVSHAVANMRTEHRRQVDTDEFTHDNLYVLAEKKKMTSINEEFFTKYGVQVLSSPFHRFDENAEGIDFETYMSRLRSGSVSFEIDELEFDTTNFQLFYNIVGSQSITAQSQTIANELFGDQNTQHLSDIIKTKSPLTSEDVKILKTLHHIAEDHSQYKSLRIAKSINTAILNLNDGLQTKNIYDILSQAAEKNIRFFEYLATLDLNILERLPQSNLIEMPKLEDTEKFQILQDILEREAKETHLIVVNDFHAMTSLSKALGITSITRAQLRDELSYQDTLDELFEAQSIVVVTQDMIKSSLDLVQANRLIQYQLNTEISDIIQTQNRINRIGQTRETRGYYIASDALQENLIDLFLASYQNIRVAHKGIVELFVDVTSQINIVNNYLAKAFESLDAEDNEEVIVSDDITDINTPSDGVEIVSEDSIANAILYPQADRVQVIVPTADGGSFVIGYLTDARVEQFNVQAPILAQVNLDTLEVSL